MNLAIQGGQRRSLTQLYQDTNHVWSPTVNRTIRHQSTHHPLYWDTHNHFSPTTTRHIRHLRVEHPVVMEQHHHLTVKRVSAKPTYAIANQDTYNLGRIALYKDGVLQGSALQLPPTPVSHANNLLGTTSAPNPFYVLNGPNHHGTHGGGGSGGSSGNPYIASLSIDTLTSSPTLGSITAIRSDGVGISSAQSATDLFYLKSEVDTFVAALQASLTALTARVTALEAQRLATKLDPNLSALDVDQITFDNNHFGKQYFSATKTLHVFTGTTLPTNTPY